MLESLKTNLPLLNTIGVIAIPVLVVLGILKPISTPKTRMKKRIIRKLTEKANKGVLLFSEIRLRDDLMFQNILYKNGILSKKFYNLFIESIRELETEKEITRESNWNLEFFTKDQDSNFPAYSSKAKKIPTDYGFREDEPRLYLGLNSGEVQDYLGRLRQKNAYTAERMRCANPW